LIDNILTKDIEPRVAACKTWWENGAETEKASYDLACRDEETAVWATGVDITEMGEALDQSGEIDEVKKINGMAQQIVGVLNHRLGYEVGLEKSCKEKNTDVQNHMVPTGYAEFQDANVCSAYHQDMVLHYFSEQLPEANQR